MLTTGPPIVGEPTVAERGDWPLRVVCCLLALFTVAPLLAWVSDLGTFAAWYRSFTFPSLVVLAGFAVFATAKAAEHPKLRAAFVTGTVGGLLGTAGYDLVRIPVVMLGRRVLAPIDSYGVLLLDATSSGPWTGVAGWTFHVTNGVCFGIAYAMVALGRRWWWGLAWAMVLESATIVTPFADDYGVRGNWTLIGIAYAAHVAYGVPLGKAVEDPDRTMRLLGEISRRTVTWVLVGTAAALLIWQHPWSMPATYDRGVALAPGPSAVIVDDRMAPTWIRVPAGGCAVLLNEDDTAYELHGADGKPILEPGEPSEVCFSDVGVHRLRATDRAYSGGFVIVDDQMAGGEP